MPASSVHATAFRQSVKSTATRAQFVADALNLLCASLCSDKPSAPLAAPLAVCGGLTAPFALAFLPLLLVGAVVGRLALAIVLLHAAAAAVRVNSLRDSSGRHLDRAAPPLESAASAFAFVPEAVLRWVLRGEASRVVWHGAAGELSIGPVPSPAHIRELSRERAAKPVVIVNLCGSFAGYSALYASLGVEQLRMPSGRADVVEIVATLRKLLDDRRGLRLLLHCETGSFAAAVAAAVVAAATAATPKAAAAQIGTAAAGFVDVAPAEAERVAKLVVSLAGGARGRMSAPKAKAPAASAADGREAASAAAAAAGAESSSSSDEEADAEAQERAQRWATYQQALATHGAPGSRPVKQEVTGGWTEVPKAVRRPAANPAVHSTDQGFGGGGAGLDDALYAPRPRPAASHAGEGLSDKQRKNARKNAKKAEAAAEREAERLERLNATMRSRAQQ